MPKTSAGILFYKFHNNTLEILLVHPGGPFWTNKDKGAWSIPKGEIEHNEGLLQAAIRETIEELGIKPKGDFLKLSKQKQKNGKIIHAWALHQAIDVKKIKSNTFEMVWPPNSGRKKSFPEIDKAAWFKIKEAKEKILEGQKGFLNELSSIIQNKTATKA
ncbi:NUDIX domain-containing protein [Maribacter sp. CXY002]|uniref:NUDIX domain-containing protein n=1 Tax=Maribacter luteocoastalis TaxID=3407671 RepID=UPI003B677953